MNRPRSRRESPARTVAKKILEGIGRTPVAITGSAVSHPRGTVIDLRHRVDLPEIGLERASTGHGIRDRENTAAR